MSSNRAAEASVLRLMVGLPRRRPRVSSEYMVTLRTTEAERPVRSAKPHSKQSTRRRLSVRSQPMRRRRVKVGRSSKA